jgi:molybdopterin molybdotransferase
MTGRRLLDDCFLHDRERMRHDEVLALLAERLTAITEPETVALDDAHGLYLARPAVAPRDVPLTDNAAVDGYAFAYADYYRHNSLHVVARVAAGDLDVPAVQRGEAARIFTGAPMPAGADTVAMQEDCETSAEGETVTVAKGLKPGANRRRAGEDVTAGSAVAGAGARLRPQDIAALASLGFGQVEVHAPLKLAILSTGNELVPPGTTDLLPGQVFDSNRAMLKALAATLPVDVTDLGILSDSRDAIDAVLRETAATHDVVLTTGGASRGEEDHIVTALDALGKRHMWQIAVKPGRPMTFGQIDGGDRDCVVFGLPGNPVAAFVCFLLYVRPALIRLGGGEDRPIPRFPLPAGFEIIRKKRDRREFLRGWLVQDDAGRTTVQKFPRDGSGLISGLRQASGLIELDEQTERVRPGDLVGFLPFSAFGING